MEGARVVSTVKKSSMPPWIRCFATDFWPLFLPFLLFAPSFFLGLFSDDHFHRFVATEQLHQFGIESIPVLDLFGFLPKDTEIRSLMNDWGTLPWWVHDDLRANFFRPVSALTHMLDHWLWPNQVWLHHIHSASWGVLACFAVRRLYRQTGMGPWPIALAVFFFVVDEAHTLPIAWMANRNILIALCFGTLAIRQYIRWRKGQVAVFWCLLHLLMSLLAAEGGISAFAYMLAWSLVYEKGWRKPAVALLPVVSLIALWRIIYSTLGYGEWGTGIYADPVSDPVGFLLVALRRLPTLLLGQWLPFPTEITICLPPWALWCVSALGVFCLAFLVWQFRPLFQRRKDTQFWTLGMFFALIPVCATIPMNRLLCFAGVGAFAVLAIFLSEKKSAIKHPWFWVHGPFAMLLCVLGAGSLHLGKTLMELPERTLPADVQTHQHVVYLSSVALPVGYAMLQRINERKVRPSSLSVLAHATQDNVVTRLNPYTLSISASNGWFHLPIESIFRSQRIPLDINATIRRPLFTATVVEMTADNRPKTVRFRFDHVLEDPRYRWMCFESIKFIECDPPTQGAPIRSSGVFRF